MFSRIDKEWKKAISFTDEIENRIKKLYDKNIVYPNKYDIFNSFIMPMNKIRVVILSQEPYTNGIDTGYAFAYKNKMAKPKSFKNIEREYGKRLNNNLKEWKNLGIFSVNSSLTVIKDKPNSHKEVWFPFTKLWLEKLSEYNHNITYLLMGNVAQSFAIYIKSGKIYKSPHPATRFNNFIGCGIFKNIKN